MGIGKFVCTISYQSGIVYLGEIDEVDVVDTSCSSAGGTSYSASVITHYWPQVEAFAGTRGSEKTLGKGQSMALCYTEIHRFTYRWRKNKPSNQHPDLKGAAALLPTDQSQRAQQTSQIDHPRLMVPQFCVPESMHVWLSTWPRPGLRSLYRLFHTFRGVSTRYPAR